MNMASLIPRDDRGLPYWDSNEKYVLPGTLEAMLRFGKLESKSSDLRTVIISACVTDESPSPAEVAAALNAL
jgi:hypothetical protein